MIGVDGHLHNVRTFPASFGDEHQAGDEISINGYRWKILSVEPITGGQIRVGLRGCDRVTFHPAKH